jgi:hypothetical protein
MGWASGLILVLHSFLVPEFLNMRLNGNLAAYDATIPRAVSTKPRMLFRRLANRRLCR